jgi:quinoprotein dehydrogenase-associated probable ABC transporter substrate-binding protein
MFSPFRNLAAGAAVLVAMGTAAGPGAAAPERSPASLGALRVCADPNNLPFSNQRGEGFENQLASLISRDLHAGVEYTWWAQRRGFVRNTLKKGTCDVIMGVPATMDMVLRTAPYYRSTYVFVTRRDGGVVVRSFDDSVLRRVRVGVQLIGDDGANTPPAHALARRGIVRNVTGYTVYGDYAKDSPPSRIIEAVARGEIDVAIAWGPMAGYWARRAAVPLTLTPVQPQMDGRSLPFVFDIALGLRRGDTAFRASLDSILTRRRAEIDQILEHYGVPRLALTRGPAS